MGKRRVGLALGSGAARGIAHIGVLEVLQREGIPIDMIAGSSIGAAIGALYAQGKDINIIKGLVLDLRRRQLASLVDLALPKSGFIQGKRIKNLLEVVIGHDTQFSDLKIPFACVATDLETGGGVVFKNGSVMEAVRASISIPIIFTLVSHEGRYLVDGGLANPVPVSVVKEMGADFVIAVNVIPDTSAKVHQAIETRVPSIFTVAMQSIYITTYSLVKASLREADIVIEPQLTHIGYGDFHQAKQCISLGQEAAEKVVSQIKDKLSL